MSIPTTTEIGNAIERAARTVAVAVAVAILIGHYAYQAGYHLGRAVHSLSAWLASATHHPLKSATDVVTRIDRALTPAPDLLTMLGAELLTDAQMAAEIAQYDANARRKRPAASRPTARRKSAGVRKPEGVG